MKRERYFFAIMISVIKTGKGGGQDYQAEYEAAGVRALAGGGLGKRLVWLH